MASQLCETKLSYHTCVNHLPIDCQQLNDSVIAGATLHRNNSKTHTHTTTVALPVAEASRERERGRGLAAICRVIIHGTRSTRTY